MDLIRSSCLMLVIKLKREREVGVGVLFILSFALMITSKSCASSELTQSNTCFLKAPACPRPHSALKLLEFSPVLEEIYVRA